MPLGTPAQNGELLPSNETDQTEDGSYSDNRFESIETRENYKNDQKPPYTKRKINKPVNPRQDVPFVAADLFNNLRNNWLREDHMNAVSVLLRKLDDSVGGINNLEFGISGKYPAAIKETVEKEEKKEINKFLQILHNGEPNGMGHWILALGCLSLILLR